jgi:hypothetical protein
MKDEKETKPAVARSLSNAGLGDVSRTPIVHNHFGVWFRVALCLKLSFQRFILRCQFRYLIYESRYLRLKLLYLGYRNRQLKDRLFATRIAHGLPPNGYSVTMPNVKLRGDAPAGAESLSNDRLET